MFSNVDGINNKMEEIKILFNDKKNEIDLGIFVETNPKNITHKYNESEFEIKRFKLLTENFMTARFRGIFCYINLKFSYRIINIGVTFHEYMCVSLLNSSELVFILIVYRSPSSNSDNNVKLIELLTKFFKFKGCKIIVGDFNFPNIDWINKVTSKNNKSVEQKFLNILNDNFLSQLVLSPTRFRSTFKNNILDLVLVEDVEIISNLTLDAPIGKSDHVVLKFLVKTKIGFKTITREKLNFDKGDYVRLNEYIIKYLYEDFDDDIGYKCVDQKLVNKVWDKFCRVISLGVQKFIPIKKCINKNNNVKLTNEIKSLMRKKNNLWKKYLRTRNYETFGEYKSIRNEIKKNILIAKHKNMENLAKKIKSNPKVFWQHIRQVKGSKSIIDGILSSDKDGNEIMLFGEKDKAQEFANYFSSVYINEDNVGGLCFNDDCGILAMNEIVLTQNLVYNKISKLNKYKSAGPDGIFSRILFECVGSVSKYLSFLFNLSLGSGYLPDIWKRSTVVPVYKKGGCSSVVNYRPVSLTCISCKILEFFIKESLLSHFVENKLFNSFQYGFVKGRSTTLQLLKILDDWTDAVDNGLEINVVYTDFEKAFDRISHKKLINKLKFYKVNKQLIIWISNYLSNRSFSVSVNGEQSEWFKASSGVPQGSVLGPILFIIYVNDLFDVCKNYNDVKLFLFADDAKIYKRIQSANDRNILQTVLNSMVEWCVNSDVILNVSKCVWMNVGKKDGRDCRYSINGVDLECVENIKDLGVIVNRSLKFDEHIYDIVSKAYNNLRLIHRHFQFLNKFSFITIYKTMIRSILEYAGSVWSPWKIELIEHIEKVQKRATKMVNECRGLNYKERLIYLDLPTLKYRRIRGDLILLYKGFINGEMNECYPDIILHSSDRTRGHDKKLKYMKFNTNLRKYFYTYRIISIWNGLPDNIVNEVTMNGFERGLDEFWNKAEFKFDWRMNAP